MHYSAKHILSIFILFVFTSSVAAQDLHRSGSVYSSFGMGLPNDYRAPHAGAMNVMGTALIDDRISNTANPALLGTNRYTNVNGGFNITGYNASDDFGSATSTHIQANQLQISLPLLRDRFGMSVSLLPVTNYNYRVYDSGTLGEDQVQGNEPLGFDSEITGTGGLNRMEIGAGYRIARQFYIGVAPAFYFGTLERQVNYTIESDEYIPIDYNQKTSYTGLGGQLGLMLYQTGLATPNDMVSFAATASLPVELDAERRVETLEEGETKTLREADYYGQQTVKYPMEMSFGIMYGLNNLRITSDIHYQNWASYEPFDFNENVNYIDRVRLGLGAEYSAYNPNVPGSFFQDLIYRAGVSYDTGNLELNNETINTMRASVGIGIPTQQRTSSFNINFDYGSRGTLANGLIRENIYEVRLSFNLSELMFFRPRLR